jgi:UrcA family protein
MFKTKYVLSSVAASALWMGSAAVPAADAPIERSTAVRFADLNLDRQADVATLYQRISAAADQLCASRVGLYDTLYRYQGCVSETVHKAVGSVNRAALTEYYRQQQSPEATIKVARQ